MIRLLRRTWQRLLGSLPFRKADHDLAEELESHIQLLADENILMAVGAIACLVPARRATGANTIDALRFE